MWYVNHYKLLSFLLFISIFIVAYCNVIAGDMDDVRELSHRIATLQKKFEYKKMKSTIRNNKEAMSGNVWLQQVLQDYFHQHLIYQQSYKKNKPVSEVSIKATISCAVALNFLSKLGQVADITVTDFSLKLSAARCDFAITMLMPAIIHIEKKNRRQFRANLFCPLNSVKNTTAIFHLSQLRYQGFARSAADVMVLIAMPNNSIEAYAVGETLGIENATIETVRKDFLLLRLPNKKIIKLEYNP